MCITVVNLPTVISFLMLYSLRCGCVTIFLWTAFRSIFCLFFFMTSIAELFVPHIGPFGVKLFVHEEGMPAEDLQFPIFYSYIIMIIIESLMLVHLIYLAVGLYNDSPDPIGLYLICRFFTLLSEILFLIVLCLCHQLLIGWYLGVLMFVVLEFYSFIVVFSYYVDVKEEENKTKTNYR